MQDGELPALLTGRDIQHKNWTGLTKQDEVIAALSLLMSKNWVIKAEEPGKKAPRFRLAKEGEVNVEKPLDNR